MIGGLVVYAAFEFHRYMTTMFFNIFLLQGGALLMITSHNFLFQMHTQRRMVELGVVVAQFDATAKQPTPPRKTSEFEAQDI
jgi:hypothetical protein